MAEIRSDETPSIFNFKKGEIMKHPIAYLRFDRPGFEPKSGVEINFFNHLPVGQVISKVYLQEKILTCPRKKGTISFEAVYFWKKNCKMYLLIKTLNFHSTCILFRESGFFARLLW